MRVLHVMTTRGQDGVAICFQNLLEAFARAGIAQDVILKHRSPHAGRVSATCTIVTLPFRRQFDPFTPLAIRQRVRAVRPDVVIGWNKRAIQALSDLPVPIIGRRVLSCDPVPLRRCRFLACNRPALVQYYLQAGLAQEQVKLIPDSVLQRPETPMDRRVFATPQNAPLLLGIGYLQFANGFDLLLRIMPTLPGCYLWIAGEGPERAALQRLAAELGILSRVRFLGHREDRAALLGAADLCVIPARGEVTGLVALEAWSMGCPLVVAAASGLVGLVRHKADVLLVPSEDTEALIAAILDLLRNPAATRARVAAGARRAVEEFAESEIVARWRQFLHGVVPE